MEIFKYLRNYFNLSQEDLAKKLSIKQATIASYESGNYTPSISVCLKAIKLYDISLDFLIFGDKAVYPKNLKLIKLACKIDSNFSQADKSYIGTAITNFLGRKCTPDDAALQDTSVDKLGADFHENLKALRKLKGMTQIEFAGKIGVSRNLLAQYELKAFPPSDRLFEISLFLNVSAHALVTGEKLRFNFNDPDFGLAVLQADHSLSLEQHKILITLMEAVLGK